ncbi:hypothetical protein N7541_006801 [Penicillium brevicompactum]|uniref:Uncharacterized protein n=1 Tax=Penicillium brevicompactum TaxID=5074 RepID=A0A9W9UR56_PENBR|nr:hypothetical protein N7541_006801 [Penicillium brevicompactum]
MASQKRTVLLLSLAYQETFDDVHGRLVDAFLSMANVKRAKTPKSTLTVLENTPLTAIIITDEGLAKPDPKKKEVFALVWSFIEIGGLVIVGQHFPSCASEDQYVDFFKAFGLPWKRGDYHRTDFEINPSSIFPFGLRPGAMPHEYSMKAVHVRGATESQRMFVAAPGAQTQSNAFAPQDVDRSQAAVAAARIGQGTLVYCGDVSGEGESVALIMSLCGWNY